VGERDEVVMKVRGYNGRVRKRQGRVNTEPEARKTAESEPSTSSRGQRANGGIGRRAEGGSGMHRHPRPQVPMCGQNGGREPRARKVRARGTAGGIPSERRGLRAHYLGRIIV
jgi:hypothetical protein